MNVLWVTYGLPYPPDSGVKARDFYLIREVARTAAVHLFSLEPRNDNTIPGELAACCSSIEIFPIPKVSASRVLLSALRGLLVRRPVAMAQNYLPSASSRLQAIVLRHRIHVLQVEHSLQAAYGQFAAGEANCKRILSFHNVAYRQYSRMATISQSLTTSALYRVKSAVMKRAEAYYARRYDACILASRREQKLLESIAPGTRTEIVENGVDCVSKRPLAEEPGEPALLFVGVMDYPPNADAAIFFARSILPTIRAAIPKVRFYIVGHSPTAPVEMLARESGIEVSGHVDDLVPYYRRASVIVVPLRAGGGTRLKILEAMAYGRVVVSTSVGCEGLELKSGEHLLVGDTPQEFAGRVLDLLASPDLRRRLASNARCLVEEKYDWRIAGKRLAAIHRELADGVPREQTAV